MRGLHSMGLLCIVASCSYPQPTLRSDDIEGDAGPPIDGESCIWSWTPSNFDLCATGVPGPFLKLDIVGAYSFNTDTGVLKDPNEAATTPPSVVLDQSTSGAARVRVLAVTGLQIDDLTTVRIVGQRPLVVAVHGTAIIAGTIDASAQAATPGPGAGSPQTCGSSTGGSAGVSVGGPSGSGGGGGGAYGARGGNGGDGNGTGAGPPGAGGLPSGDASLQPLHGGCPGGPGGREAGSSAGPAGQGGGAIQIVARDHLSLSGKIISAGSGGPGGSFGFNGSPSVRIGNGGAGGGSGGAIFLESATISIAATGSVCANGGGGGEASDTILFGGTGGVGTCSETVGATSLHLRPTLGGTGGYAVIPVGGNGQNAAGTYHGGGGGGGGVGRIRIRAISQSNIDSSSVITPAAAP